MVTAKTKYYGILFFSLHTVLFAHQVDLSGQVKHFHSQIVPLIRNEVNKFDTKIEPKITELEITTRNRFPQLKAFALRGISTAGVGNCSQTMQDPDYVRNGRRTLEQWRQAGYLSEAGGNFFIYNPSLKPYSADEFLMFLYASVNAAVGYGLGDIHPIVLFVEMNQNFLIPPSGGNDGIRGSYPTIIAVGEVEYLLHNLDVGSITKPTQSHQVGLTAEEVPSTRVRRRIGEQGFPSGLEIGTRFEDRWDYPESKKLILGRWFYAQVLEEIVALASKPE